MTLTKNDLLVLGFLLERPMHGYEISQALKVEGVEVWFEISTASIYYSLNKLRRQGIIAEARSRSSSGEKTIYHVTEYGREQFFEGTEALLDSTEPIRTEYDLGIFMLNRVPQDRAAELLEKRIAFLHQWVVELEERLEATKQHPLQQTILQHAISHAQLDIEWLMDIITKLQEADACGDTVFSMMSLTGDLQDFHLPDLLKLIASGKHNGTLLVNANSRQRSITFQQGRPHCAGSQTTVGLEKEPDQVLNDIYGIFHWQEGTFVFDQRSCPQEGCVLLDMDVNTLILTGARRLETWDIIQRIVPTSEALFEPRDTETRGEPLALLDDEQNILNTVDGFKDVTRIAREVELTEFETSKILYGLYAVGLIQAADPDKSRLRRVFREFAELMCRGAIPYRTTPEEATTCENEVNRRCEGLPVSIRNSRIEDHCDSSLRVDELAEIYRTFLQTQHTVLSERLGKEIANELRQQVLNRISPDLRATLEQYALL